MKKFLTIALIAIFCSLGAQAKGRYDDDGGKTALGAKFIYASRADQLGVGLDFQLNLTRNIRLAPELQYLFRTDGISTFDLGCNLQYVSTLFDDLAFYPLLGVSYQRWSRKIPYVEDPRQDVTANVNKIACNVGLGVEYAFTRHIYGAFELRGQFTGKDELNIDRSQCVILVGLKYRF